MLVADFGQRAPLLLLVGVVMRVVVVGALGTRATRVLVWRCMRRVQSFASSGAVLARFGGRRRRRRRRRSEVRVRVRMGCC